MPSAAQATWRRAETTHFVIYSEQKEEQLQSFAEKLERFDAALRKLYPVRSDGPVGRVTIYELPNGTALRRVMNAVGANVDGVYRADAAGALALTSRAATSETWSDFVLLHEYAHHFMLQNFTAAFPKWYVEGFAEFVATTRFEKDGLSLGLPALHRSYAFQMRGTLPLQRILANDFEGADGDDIAYLYGIGWALTHYLTFDEARKGQLSKYLQAIDRGTAPGEAAEVFGDVRLLERELDGYIHRRFRYLTYPYDVLPTGKIEVSAVSPAENAIIPIRIESKYGVGPEEAKRLVPLARAAAAPYPDDLSAQCMLAEAEYDAGNFSEAERAVDRALAKAPEGYCALIYKAMVQVAVARKNKAAASDPAWSTARRTILRANRAALGETYPMLLYYQSFGSAGGSAPTSAVNALIAAADAVPQDKYLQLLATKELLHARREEEARRRLGRVVVQVHGKTNKLADIYHRIGKDDPSKLVVELEGNPTDEADKRPGKTSPAA
jgi:tetratricopeptide (TPR) repeat protein